MRRVSNCASYGTAEAVPLRELLSASGSGDDDRGTVFGFVFDGEEGCVGFAKREGSDLGAEFEREGDLEEVVGVLPGHVGDGADLALAPEQRVVVEGGH